MTGRRTYSISEVAAILCGDSLRAPERWVLRRIQDGTIPAIKVGRTFRVTAEQLDEAIRALQVQARPERPATPAPDPEELVRSLCTGATPTTRRRMRRAAS